MTHSKTPKKGLKRKEQVSKDKFKTKQGQGNNTQCFRTAHFNSLPNKTTPQISLCNLNIQFLQEIFPAFTFTGTIRPFAVTFCPQEWHFCTLLIADKGRHTL